MKSQSQTIRYPLPEPPVDTPPTTMTEYLTIIRNFILQMHQRVNEQFDPEVLPPTLTSIIDRAAVKLKTNKQQLGILEKQNQELQNNKILLTELRAEQTHLQKRFGQKNDQISILRETVKALYSDNERLNAEKQKLSKELVTAKESTQTMKKKLKKQQEQMGKHKQQLQKLTKIAEERLGEYATEDKEKQKSIKKLTQQNQKLRVQLQKQTKNVQQLRVKNEQLSKIKSEHEANIKFIEALKYENELCKKEKQSLMVSVEEKTKRFTEQLASLRNQLCQQSQKTLALSISLKQLEMVRENSLIKIKAYEEDILLRTEKLKEKNEQIQKYDEEITKLLERIQSLSEMSTEVIKQNQILNERCQILEQRLQEGRAVQQYVQKIKGEINYSKSMELGRLIEALGNIRGKI